MHIRSYIRGVTLLSSSNTQITGNIITHRIMESQKKISTFFSPLRTKRENTEVTDNGMKRLKPESSAHIPEKKTCATDDTENRSSEVSPSKTELPNSPPISPEQKVKIEDNKLKARIKLTEKQTHGLVTNIGTSWFKALEPEFSKPYFVKLADFVCKERSKYTVYPPANDVFSWTQKGHIRDIKVVILGQDPYHGVGQAHGLCFSVQKGIAVPPSLVNMYKELTTDIEGFKTPKHGTLTGWADQGVLLLNACLTVKAHTANSHKDQGWEKFTDAVISWVNKNSSGVVFILWGAYAQKKGACIDKKKHHVLKGPHPSPLSAHRGFFGCKHFSQCNTFLRKHGKEPINWSNLPSQD